MKKVYKLRIATKKSLLCNTCKPVKFAGITRVGMKTIMNHQDNARLTQSHGPCGGPCGVSRKKAQKNMSRQSSPCGWKRQFPKINKAYGTRISRK